MLFDIYKPQIYDVSSTRKKRVLEHDPNIEYLNTICMPLMKLGFHMSLYKTKERMELLNQFSNRKKIYLVTSLFEKEIDRPSDNKIVTIGEELDNFIHDNISKKNPPILTRAYLKLWEIILMFDLIPQDNKFISSHLAEGPGSFIQATILYRDYLAAKKKVKSSNDKYYAVTLHSTNEYLHMEKQFMDHYNKEKPKRLHILETIPTKDINDLYGGGYEEKTNGDLTKLSTINIFAGGAKTKAFAEKSDFITADGGFEWKNENFQEQEAFRLIFGEILTALKTQNDNGHFVLKIFDTFTLPTLYLIELLKDYYKNVYICKPYTSRASNSEKYIVCKYFKGISDKDLTILDKILVDLDKNKNYYVNQIFPTFKIDENDLQYYVKINNKLALSQYIAMNKILTFLQLDNKNGAEYNDYHNLQINATKLWIDKYLKNINSVANNIKPFIITRDSINIITNNKSKSVETTETTETSEKSETTETTENKSNSIEEPSKESGIKKSKTKVIRKKKSKK